MTPSSTWWELGRASLEPSDLSMQGLLDPQDSGEAEWVTDTHRGEAEWVTDH